LTAKLAVLHYYQHQLACAGSAGKTALTAQRAKGQQVFTTKAKCATATPRKSAWLIFQAKRSPASRRIALALCVSFRAQQRAAFTTMVAQP